MKFARCPTSLPYCADLLENSAQTPFRLKPSRGAVRDRRRNGAKFRRQVVMGNYIVDFVCFDGGWSAKSTVRLMKALNSEKKTSSATPGCASKISEYRRLNELGDRDN